MTSAMPAGANGASSYSGRNSFSTNRSESLISTEESGISAGERCGTWLNERLVKIVSIQTPPDERDSYPKNAVAHRAMGATRETASRTRV